MISSVLPVESYIKKGCIWADLPNEVQNSLDRDKGEYEARVLVYFLQNQMEYTGLITLILRNEKTYYQQLIHYSSQQLMLFPYHLQRKVVAGLKITPFDYYRTIVYRTMLAEYSYDRIPNFTAAACFQTLGIGRNEFIDLLNVYKGIPSTLLSGTSEPPVLTLSQLLPQKPLDCQTLEPWFIARVGSVSLKDVDASTVEEQALLDRIIDHNSVTGEGNDSTTSKSGLTVSELPLPLLQKLYRRGLVYFDVPIYDDDCISVPTLDGFIMNRITGDCCETMLYKIFVSLDPNTCIGELAEDLSVNIELVRNAASVFCRLGFAKKTERTNAHINLPRKSKVEGSTIKTPQHISLIDPSLKDPEDPFCKKIAFIFDSTITAYLMLGNLSANLKKHSVTMFEVGKLTGNSLTAFFKELSAVSNSRELDVGIYFEHARCLSQTLSSLSGLTEGKPNFDRLDLIRCGSLDSLEPATRCHILSKNYDLLVCMAPLSYEEAQVFSESWPLTLGPTTPVLCSPWLRLFFTYLAGGSLLMHDAMAEVSELTTSMTLPCLLLCRVTSWGHDPVLMDIYTLFNSANELVLTSPILIQAYDDRDSSNPLHQRFLPLPLSKSFLARHSDKIPWLKCLGARLDLHSLIGYVSLLVPDDIIFENECNAAQPDNLLYTNAAYQPNTTQFFENTIIEPKAVLSEADFTRLSTSRKTIFFLTVHMGIPLFNSALNSCVFASVAAAANDTDTGIQVNEVKTGLLADRSLFSLSLTQRDRLAQSNATLRKDLNRFIETVGGVQLVDGDSCSPCDASGLLERKNVAASWPLPTRSFVCSDGRIFEWD